MLSGSGKAGHILFRKATMSTWGPTDYHYGAHLQTHLVECVMLTFVCILGYHFIVPRCRLANKWTTSQAKAEAKKTDPTKYKEAEEKLDADKKEEDALYDTAGYVFVYIWAFGIVNAMWWFFYTYIGFRTSPMIGLLLFWAQLPVCLIIYIIFAAKCSPKYSFYEFDDKKYTWAGTFSVFMYWIIDNTTWWGWFQTIVDIDTDADSHPVPGQPVTHSPKIIMLNLCCIIGLALLSAGITVANQAALSRAKRCRTLVKEEKEE